MRTLLIDLEAHGDEIWRKFRGSPEETLWFYESVAQAIRARLANGLEEELLDAVKVLRDTVG